MAVSCWQSLQIDKALIDLVLVGPDTEVSKAQRLLPSLHVPSEPLFFSLHKQKEVLLSLLFVSRLLVKENICSTVVYVLILLSDLLLLLDQNFLILLRQSVEHTRTPLYVMDVLLESILGNNLTDEIPYLVAFFSTKEDKSARGVYTKEGHAIDHEVLFGKLKSQLFFAFILDFLDDHSQRESSPFCAFFCNVIESKEGSIGGENNSILKIIADLSQLDNFQIFLLHGQIVEGDNVSHVDALYCLILRNNGHAVVYAVEGDVAYILSQLYTAYLEGITHFYKIGYLDCGGKVTLFEEFAQRNSNPLSLLTYMDLSVFGVLTPGPPLPLPLGLHIVQEYSR